MLTRQEIAVIVDILCDTAALSMKRHAEVNVYCNVLVGGMDTMCAVTVTRGDKTVYVQAELRRPEWVMSTSDVATALRKQANKAFQDDVRIRGEVVYIQAGTLVVRRS